MSVIRHGSECDHYRSLYISERFYDDCELYGLVNPARCFKTCKFARAKPRVHHSLMR